MSEFLKKASFSKSIVEMKDRPTEFPYEIVFVGKSNVGKSSLINAVTNNKKLAYTSSKPGHTRLLNYYRVEDRFYLVDCPGYGFSAQKGVDYAFYGKMVESYFDNNDHLKLIVFLLDSRHEPTNDDLDFYTFLKEFNYKRVICMTKCDKLNMSMKSKINKNIAAKFGKEALNEDIIHVSTLDKASIAKLSDYILNVMEEKIWH